MENREIDELVAQISADSDGIEIQLALSAFSSNLAYYYLSSEKANCKGFGASTQHKTALLKALSEYFERKSFLEVSKSETKTRSTSGFATHPREDVAKENAISELIERDALLIAWLARYPPYWLSDNELLKLGSEEILALKNSVNVAGFRIKLGIVAKTGDYFTIIGLAENFTGGQYFWAIDTSCSKIITNALKSAVVGSVFFCDIFNMNQYNNEKKLITEDLIAEPIDHLYYHGFRPTEKNWLVNSAHQVLELKLPEAQFKCRDKNMNFKLFTFQAIGVNFQEYFVGSTKLENINYQRLNQLGLGDLTLNFTPHPLS